ncbi:MAG: malto-oligosyltrehalose synthase, partial [Streptosporangiales bacterium]|nr:malto-oligosyltrehalose synthase [Streptosporangiales bacterium]
MATPPVSTYRLQLTPDFGFEEAAAQASYLASLGVTHAYLSPILQAAPGSSHGYDITDHSRISAELGGEDGFRAMTDRFRREGLGIVLDIVPNHMAVPAPESLNRQLWDVLARGPGSEYAHWFDIDWEAGDGKMLMPFLGKPLDQSLDEITVDTAVHYYDHEFPLRPGTEDLPLPELLDAQHYRLAWWREGLTTLNWRRFFDVTSLIGVRVEDPGVFAATHETVLRLVREGLVDGLRVDHPDGLADPRGYLRRLTAAAGTWVVVEKILQPAERLPADWPCAGTTGYDSLRVTDGLFVDPAGGDRLTREYERYARHAGGGPVPVRFADVALAAKREIAGGVLGAEVARLVPALVRARPGTEEEKAARTVTEVLAAFGVYRAYTYPGERTSPTARRQVRDAVAAAKRHLPGSLRSLADTVGDLALGGDRDFAVRFGQTTGPVLAKGIEDTASYRWPRLAGRNEVGGDPDRFAVAPAEFHEFAAHLAARWPRTMTTLSTHDTKRQEDVRARLAVLAEMPAEWGRQAARWRERAARLVPESRDLDPEITYLLWQTLAGAWPISEERLGGYLVKAMREAKTRTSWLSVDEDYERTVLKVASAALADGELSASIEEFVESIKPDGTVNALGAKLVQLTMPGIPDVYQGCERPALSLVDPDNRRPVFPAGDTSGGKFQVTSRTLNLRRDRPEWFLEGGYVPLSASGPAADHVVAFARGGKSVTVATRLPRGLRERGGWGD